ncbi:zinc ABC transporter substrate-binding protein [Desulfococcaceae bacterium HSG8]|nr:zinc ABC transporter substrate-binding protein [Desulfococcaceae bacterium HSG8]
MKYFKMLMLLCVFCMIGRSGATASEPVPVFVSILPQKYFTEKIGGEFADVSVMVGSGGNPHNYEPKPRQMAKLSKAAVYFAVGVQFENVWLERFASVNKNMLIVRAQDGIRKIPMTSRHHEKEHVHGQLTTDNGQLTTDPHIWLSPPLVKIMAGNILNGFLTVDPGHKAEYETNHRKFINEIDALDAEIRKIFAEKGEKSRFMVFHPSWGYFAHTYGLEQIPVEIEGKSPKPAELRQLITDAKKRDISVIFVQPQFSTANAEVIAKGIGGQVVFADPLAGNWAENLRQMAAKFRAALR